MKITGRRLNVLTEYVNRIHCDVQELESTEKVDEILGHLEELREELAEMAASLGAVSPHFSGRRGTAAQGRETSMRH
jgi:Ni,Fe-hydrogenase III large subunit